MKLKELKRSDITFSNVKGFLQGYWRAFLLYFGFSINHKAEIFFYRIGSMDIHCIENRQCPCKCEIVYKQLEDRACEKHCYEPMMSREEWKLYRNNKDVMQKVSEGKERIKRYNIEIPEPILKHLDTF